MLQKVLGIIERRVFMIIEDVVQSLMNMCFYVVCSWILTEPHTNQI